MSPQPTHANSHGSAVCGQDGTVLHISRVASLSRSTLPAKGLSQSAIVPSPEPLVFQPRSLVGVYPPATKPAPRLRSIGLPVVPPRQPTVIPQTTDQPPKRPHHSTRTLIKSTYLYLLQSQEPFANQALRLRVLVLGVHAEPQLTMVSDPAQELHHLTEIGVSTSESVIFRTFKLLFRIKLGEFIPVPFPNLLVLSMVRVPTLR